MGRAVGIRSLFVLLALIFGGGPSSAADRAGRFDFYVLSLSWSPSWCADNDPSGRTQQCGGKRRYGLVVHGLWPQSERSWPEFCATSEPDRVPDGLIRSYYDLIPSAGLAGHEWRKHGSCSGLSQQAYFRHLRSAYQRLKLPALIFNGDIDRKLAVNAIESQLIRANPGLTADAISLACDGGQLSEIRVCLSKSLDFRPCPELERRSCRSTILTLPAIP